MLKIYHVSSGSWARTVKSVGRIQAVKAALSAKWPKRLGLIIEVTQEGKESYYVSSERILREMGRWAE